MQETFYVVKQNADRVCLLSKPNQILYSTTDQKEARSYFDRITGGQRVYPYEFEKGIYVFLSKWHYVYHPSALYIIDSNTFPV